MKSDARAFADSISALLGPHDAIRVVQPTRPGLLPVCCFMFQDRPETGLLTIITYGLSLSNHPTWREEKPELIASVRSKDEEWGLALSSFAERLRGEEPFDDGSILIGATQLALESEMEGFVLGDTQPEDQDHHRIDLPTRTVRLRRATPIYECEVDFIRRVGAGQFLQRPNADFFDIQRDHIWQV
jgi:Suppressor of fused protein (SUFU)